MSILGTFTLKLLVIHSEFPSLILTMSTMSLTKLIVEKIYFVRREKLKARFQWLSYDHNDMMIDDHVTNNHYPIKTCHIHLTSGVTFLEFRV